MRGTNDGFLGEISYVSMPSIEKPMPRGQDMILQPMSDQSFAPQSPKTLIHKRRTCRSKYSSDCPTMSVSNSYIQCCLKPSRRTQNTQRFVRTLASVVRELQQKYAERKMDGFELMSILPVDTESLANTMRQ
jgi:hypothetical protein